MLAVPAGTTGVDAGIGIHCGVEASGREKLFDDFKGSRLRIEQNFGAQVPKLVWRKHDASAPFCISRNQPCDGTLALRRAVDIYEQSGRTMADDFRSNTVAILHQHCGKLDRNIEREVYFVFDFVVGQFQC